MMYRNKAEDSTDKVSGKNTARTSEPDSGGASLSDYMSVVMKIGTPEWTGIVGTLKLQRKNLD